MSNHNICFCREMTKLFVWKVLDIFCELPQMTVSRNVRLYWKSKKKKKSVLHLNIYRKVKVKH